MKKINILLILISGLFLLAACSDSPVPAAEQGQTDGSDDQKEDPSARVPIEFYSSGMLVETTRADFPNNQFIGVVAAYTDQGTVDWRSYPDIMGASAQATSQVSGTYYFDWVGGMKYWPFDGRPLAFLAYSPVGDGAAVELDYNPRYLNLTLTDDMPQVMYASNNEKVTSYSKDTYPVPSVDLGEFRNALSRLDIRIEGDQTTNPSLTVGLLNVTTDKSRARLDLLNGDNGPVVAAGTDPFTYRLITAPTPFADSGVAHSVYLYPGTEQDTRILITVNDSTYPFSAAYVLSDIADSKDPSGRMTLERGVITTVVITISGTEIEQPDNNIHLAGYLSDWKYPGNFGVTIN